MSRCSERAAVEVLRAWGIELVAPERLRSDEARRRVAELVQALEALRIEVRWCVHLEPVALYERLYVRLVVERLGLPRPGGRYILDMIEPARSGEYAVWLELYAPAFDATSHG